MLKKRPLSTIADIRGGCDAGLMRAISSATLLLMFSSSPAAAEVSLQDLLANPLSYEGRLVRTCGKHRVPDALYTGMILGRHPVVIRFDRAIEGTSKCVEAKLRRSIPSPPLKLEYEAFSTANDGPVAVKGWHLQVIRADPG